MIVQKERNKNFGGTQGSYSRIEIMYIDNVMDVNVNSNFLESEESFFSFSIRMENGFQTFPN